MGAVASCMGGGGGAVEVKCARLSRGVKFAEELKDFSKKEKNLNVHIDFSSASPMETAVVTWKALKVAGHKFRDGQTLYVDEIPLKRSSVTSTYMLKTGRKAWPTGQYKIEVHVQLSDDTFKKNNFTKTDAFGRKKLTGYGSSKFLNTKGGATTAAGRLVLNLPYSVN
mmetsp:Transcript_41619/g.102559  ORF Transcript_41619/g.102559 Transcript_41619/m.102559 type:complete len:168 (+) Transcript_41619:323-826(+)|eukprot:CAMPEP_0197577280 /NCGR_PEP_ID=MMETSP1326-20131121/1976_1 /TAXON_ID=1155430 /ORGANISM="Genus nov. species nov., Strain RCC2288" /LENGTH=167 /DNA_ID=CAMNT_0043140331 /DNA_START=292 /DNA_END=795 /DNA_ORIENTATION=-